MFAPSQADVRRFFCQVHAKTRTGEPLEAIETIAKKHGLKVIYDGAHAFGVLFKGKSLLSYGDISTCSFHATKLFGQVLIKKLSPAEQCHFKLKRSWFLFTRLLKPLATHHHHSPFPFHLFKHFNSFLPRPDLKPVMMDRITFYLL